MRRTRREHFLRKLAHALLKLRRARGKTYADPRVAKRVSTQTHNGVRWALKQLDALDRCGDPLKVK